jgi:tripartite-type tricarboxylate transporter receptor subunit TctC
MRPFFFPGSTMKRWLSLLIAAVALATAPVIAQTYPAKPIRFVVPFPPGGPLDVMARGIGQQLQETWGEPVVIENRPGAGGGIGAEYVAKSPADGYTLLMGAVSTHAINPSLYPRIGYDPQRDFIAVALVAQVPNILVVTPSLPVRSVQELVAYAKARPGALSFGSGSTGSTGHLAGELFKTMAGVDMVHIPYKGGAPAMQDLLAGQTQLMFDNLANALGQVKAGRLRALAVTTARRAPALPDLPTVAESGLPGFDLTTWFGVFVPAGTPRDIVTKLNGQIVQALASKELTDRLAAMGAAPPEDNTPERFAAFVRAEAAKYAKVVKASGARVD